MNQWEELKRIKSKVGILFITEDFGRTNYWLIESIQFRENWGGGFAVKLDSITNPVFDKGEVAITYFNKYYKEVPKNEVPKELQQYDRRFQ